MPVRTKVRVIDHVATGRAFRTARRSKELSLEEVSGKMGISFAMLGFLERGERNWTDDLCKRFQEALRK